ncbi:MAG TPA: hypothetical protein VIK30_11610 [Polyangia bacterium]
MSQSAILELVQRSTFIFTGEIASPGHSSLRVLPPGPGLAVVRFDRGFRVNPVLGKLDGRPITVQLSGGGAGTNAVREGQRMVFFASAWVHGEQIAVKELARLPADRKTEREVESAVAALPELHLSGRIATAVTIVHGTVTEIARATDIPRTPSEHDPNWMRALIEPREILKGQLGGASGRARRSTAALLFPGSRDIAFRDAPRPSLGQTAVFLLHEASGAVAKVGLVAPDPADIQPPRALPTVRRLLGVPTPERRSR